ncbi:electron transfer flavoprotein regulatory factor 1 [Melanaphis sacchari]|uniref:electron transfer flavoprotein regulatory factor 1 n=1 Tax=Melanaphis sacchari TaxID=742174 RepID=UPI000DC1482C|nr:electron transfer flavoprotein regulatory factor 1 [Melanaphis sacchari]
MVAGRQEVINLYKTLLYMGRDYPQGYDFFRSRLKKAFQRNSDISDPEQIKMLVKRGEFVVKEIEALYMLKKYRTLKDRYSTEKNQS